MVAKILNVLILFVCIAGSSGFVASQQPQHLRTRRVESLTAPPPPHVVVHHVLQVRQSTLLFQKMSQKRRKQLGIQDDEDEYDLDYALGKKKTLERNVSFFFSSDTSHFSLIVTIAFAQSFSTSTDANTDPLISKIIAGSFILVMIALLTVGLIIPFSTDYGEGVCNPILTGGRC